MEKVKSKISCKNNNLTNCSSSGQADSGLVFAFCGFGWYCFGFKVGGFNPLAP